MDMSSASALPSTSLSYVAIRGEDYSISLLYGAVGQGIRNDAIHILTHKDTRPKLLKALLKGAQRAAAATASEDQPRMVVLCLAEGWTRAQQGQPGEGQGRDNLNPDQIASAILHDAFYGA